MGPERDVSPAAGAAFKVQGSRFEVQGSRFKVCREKFYRKFFALPRRSSMAFLILAPSSRTTAWEKEIRNTEPEPDLRV
jgi:hypothetical protein